MNRLLICFFGLAFLVSCRRNLNEVSWDNEIVAPLVTTTLSIGDLVNGDTNFVQSGKEISFVYDEKIDPIGLKLDTLIQLGINRFKQTVTLESLELPSQNVADTISLGVLAQELGSGLFTDGSEISSFAVFILPPIDLGTQELDFSQFLTSAEISGGNLKFEINNQLSVVLATISIKAKNKDNGYVIFEKTFNNIGIGDIVSIDTNLVDLMDDNPLEGKLSVEITNVKLMPPSGASTVKINYSDFLSYKVSISDVSVTKATALFDDQEVLNEPDTTGLQDMEDVVLTGALIDTGFVEITAFNTVSAVMDFDYGLVGLTKDGNHFQIQQTLPANDQLITQIPFIDYYLYLKGHPDSTNEIPNSFFSHLIGNIRATQGQVTISLDDSVAVDLGFSDIKMKYVEGYLGQDTFGFTTGVKIDAFEELPFNGINFKTIDLKLSLDNGLGVPAKLFIRELKAINSKNGQTKSINNIDADIARAIEINKTLTSVETIVDIEGATDLINIQPDSLVLDIEIITNPNGRNGQLDNFIERVSFLRPSARVEIPLELNANGFTLNDTVDFSVNDFKIPDLLRDEKLTMLIDNNIPASGSIKATFLNSSGGIIDEILTNSSFSSSSVDVNGIATDTKRSSFVFDMPKNRLKKILNANKIVYTVTFSTSSMVDYVKVLSTNSLKVTLVGDVGLHINSEDL